MKNCTGCTACKNCCPKNAISLTLDNEGFKNQKKDFKECINCGLCEKICPLNDNFISKNLASFNAKSNNNAERKISSSGGIFSLLAKNIILKNGIVFGAIFDENFNVKISYTENDISKMRSSKYVEADVGDSFKKCKEFLENDRFVLFTGTPCQIAGLKKYLQKEYEKLLTMDTFCHGAPSNKIWKKYLTKFNKKIKKINFRDKLNSWNDYNFTIEFEDGTKFSENYKNNEYMKMFLQNKILKRSCYDCKFRSNSYSDLSCGDAWGIEKIHPDFYDKDGVSTVIIHTEKALKLFNELDIEKIEANINDFKKYNTIQNIIPMPIDRNKYFNNFNIAIVTETLHGNIGGILQAVCLHDKIKEIEPAANITFVKQYDKRRLKYFDKYCTADANGINESYTHLIVGSDQVWNRAFNYGASFEEKYLISSIKNRFTYAPSFGHHKCLYSESELKRIEKSLSTIKYVSTREMSGQLLTEKWFNKKSTPVLDPTMLWTDSYYLNKINETKCTKNTGIFFYVLDNSDEWNRQKNAISHKLNEPILSFDGSVENFLHNFNTAKYIITDSFHGSVFSLIFNKPFLCMRNIKRGNDRFDDLIIRFDLENNFVYKIDDFNLSMLNDKPNKLEVIEKYRKSSLDFLNNAIYDI